MSTVVALKTDDGAWIGADSRASTEAGEIRPGDVVKVFENGPYIIGFIGSVRGGQILKPEYFDPPDEVLGWPDVLIAQCEEKYCLAQSEQQTAIMMCNIIIGDKRTGKLYEILIDFQFSEVEQSAIGSGESFAFGSLHTTQELNINGEERVRMALEAAAALDTSTGPPIIVKKVK